MILEKLVQKMTTAIEAIMDLNLLVRSLPPSSEMMSKLHARIDAIQASMSQMEKVLLKDNENIKGLQSYYGKVDSALAGVTNEISGIRRQLQDSQTDMIGRLTWIKEEEAKFVMEQFQKIDNLQFEGRIAVGGLFIFLVVLSLLVLHR